MIVDDFVDDGREIQKSSIDNINNSSLLCITNEDYLHELLKNPKDRCLLLRIEAELLSFMNLELQVLKFPEMTSYNRMLVHRVADYFSLDHNVDLIGNSVLVSKTERSKIPELSLQDKINSFGQTTADVCEIGKFQILKREPAIVTQTQKVLDNQIEITLADREKEYQLARARIFDGLDQIKLSDKNSSTNLNTSETAGISSSTYEFNTVSSIFSNYLATNLCELNLNQDSTKCLVSTCLPVSTNTSELVTNTDINLEQLKNENINTQNGQFLINLHSSTIIDENNLLSTTNHTLPNFPPNYYTVNNVNLININVSKNLIEQSLPTTYNMSFNLNNSTVYSNNNMNNYNTNNNIVSNIPIKHQTLPFILPPLHPIRTSTNETNRPSLTTKTSPQLLNVGANNAVNCAQIPSLLPPPVMHPGIPMAALSYPPQNNTHNMVGIMMMMESQNFMNNNNNNFTSNEILSNNNNINYSMIIPHSPTNSNIRSPSSPLSANNRIPSNHPPLVLHNMPTNTYHKVYNTSTHTNNANYIVNPVGGQPQTHNMPPTHIGVPLPPPIPLMTRLLIPNHFPAHKLTNNDYFTKNSSNNHNFSPIPQQHQQILYDLPVPMLTSQGLRGPSGLPCAPFQMPFIPFQLPHVLLPGSVLANKNRNNVLNAPKTLPLNQQQQQPRKNAAAQNKSFQAHSTLQNTSNSKISGVLKVEHPLTHNIITIKVDSTNKNGKSIANPANNNTTVPNAKANQQRHHHNNNAKKITNNNKSMAAPKAGKNQKQKIT